MTFDRDQERHLKIGRAVIRNAAAALDETAANLDHNFVEAVEMIGRCQGQIIVTGVGKSAQVGRKVAAMLSSTGAPAAFLDAGEAIHGDLGGLRKGDVVLAVSHSGETLELVALLPMLKKLELPIIAITDRVDSTLSLVANVVILPGDTSRADPIGLAPTASALAAMAIGDAIALAVAQHKGLAAKDFEHHPGGALGKLMESIYKQPIDL